jgi:hypothetical protein
MNTIAIDWSGAKKPARKIWMAMVCAGDVEVRPLQSREQAFREIVEAANADAHTVVGLDFAFSFPEWFFHTHKLQSVDALWRLAEADGEEWLRACAPPFWGRAGKKKPLLGEHFRQTEERARAPKRHPKSIFQIGGAGAVGTGSIRGMPFLIRAREAGFSVWPFDAPSARMILEIYPRAFTGAVVKSSLDARKDYMAKHWPDIRASVRIAAISCEDAFDATVSALTMDAHRVSFGQLPHRDAIMKMEGEIWSPFTGRPVSSLGE